MDVDLLISEIFVRPPLWDQNNKNHHNRFISDKLWGQVAHKLHTKPITVQRKWKILREKFRASFASVPKSKSGDVQLRDYKGEWKYFKSLFFLKYQFALLEEDIDDISIKKERTGSPHNVSSTRSPSGPSNATEQKPEGSSSSRKRSVHTDDTLDILHQKRPKIDDDDNEDLNFFKSLLPHLKSLSSHDKLEYRIKLLRVTQEFSKNV
ncbi:uncharacterized protein LOC123317754 [Coccinella septempunctata]|uniref:uncharacterized protein LOC123317754 n=1 Tax=Coccinella septempunctata TaxID=41139 RepID=UPI001D089C28|nr:uncharacterized protein LOC123317754 [Coccinella septempunctata]